MSSNSSRRKKVQREWRHALAQGAREAIEAKPPEQPAVGPELAEARLRMNSSISATRALRLLAMEQSCEHAGPGQFCYRSTKGLCKQRLERATQLRAEQTATRQSSDRK